MHGISFQRFIHKTAGENVWKSNLVLNYPEENWTRYVWIASQELSWNLHYQTTNKDEATVSYQKEPKT